MKNNEHSQSLSQVVDGGTLAKQRRKSTCNSHGNGIERWAQSGRGVRDERVKERGYVCEN